MMDCTYRPRLDAYHDGQLDPAARADIERHLESCPPCVLALAELRGISRWFAAEAALGSASPSASPSTPRLSRIALYRLHANLDLLIDRGLIQLARVLTGLVASVLVLGSLWLMRARPVTPVSGVPSLAVLLDERASTPVEPGPSDWVMQELAH
jgi:anti-sigma factor RsiW